VGVKAKAFLVLLNKEAVRNLLHGPLVTLPYS